MAEQPAHPESIVTTDWVADNLGDANVRLVDSGRGHGRVRPGTHPRRRRLELDHPAQRPAHPRHPERREQMESLLGESGVASDTTVVLYGDNNNWFATYAFWQMKMYGHGDLKIMDGGRRSGSTRAESLDRVSAPSLVEPLLRSASNPDTGPLAATRDYVLGCASTDNNTGSPSGRPRSMDEYNGTLLAPANLPQDWLTARRAHLPGAA